MHRAFLLIAAFCTGLAAQQPAARPTPADPAKFLTQPLVSDIYTADPSAHVFNGRIYIYPSHDFEAGVPQDDLGSHFAMRDYHVLSMDSVGGPVTDHGVALDIKDVPWAGRQMWAPDAAEKDGKYYLYFPVKDKQDVFRIGAAVSDNPAGPFKAQPQAIRAASAWTRRSSRTATASTTCTSAASGAGSSSAGRPAIQAAGRLPGRRSAGADAEGRARCGDDMSGSPKSRAT